MLPHIRICHVVVHHGWLDFDVMLLSKPIPLAGFGTQAL
jgi:hypothetical protein